MKEFLDWIWANGWHISADVGPSPSEKAILDAWADHKTPKRRWRIYHDNGEFEFTSRDPVVTLDGIINPTESWGNKTVKPYKDHAVEYIDVSYDGRGFRLWHVDEAKSIDGGSG